LSLALSCFDVERCRNTIDVSVRRGWACRIEHGFDKITPGPMWTDHATSRYRSAVRLQAPSSSMSYDSPGSPLQPITLDSPPISPTSVNYLATAISHSPVFYSVPGLTSNPVTVTPAKRPRQKCTQDPARRKGFRRRGRGNSEVQPGSSTWTAEIGFDVSDDHQISSRSRSSSPPPCQSTVSATDEEYGRYLNLVLADCLPFYQISTTVYVVQGWDRKNHEPTVRHSVRP
jgi:hypothetical protein